MSTTSPQAAAADQLASSQAGFAKALSSYTVPELTSMIGQNGMISNLLNSTNNGQVRSSLDQSNYNSSLSQLNAGYQQAGFGDKEAINYNAMRSGEGRLSSAVPQSAIASTATSLERDRQQALSNLNFQSASSSLADYNQLLSLMGQGVNTSLGLAGGFGGASNAALGGLSTGTQMGSTLSGLGAGASLGATIGSVIPGVGTAIGGVVGGVAGGAAGYFGGGN